MIKMIGRFLIVITVSAFFTTTPGFAADGSEPFQFREDFNKVWPTGSYAKPKPWTEDEKAVVIEKLKMVSRYIPGLIQRTTAYRPLLLYRVSNIIRETIHAQAISSHNGIFFADNFFVSSGSFDYELVTLVHELVHLSDASYRIMSMPEWKRLVQPRIDMVYSTLKDKGTPYDSARLQAIGSENPKLHTMAGLPTLYAAANLSEALAEYSTHEGFRMFKAPEEISRFVQANVLSVPYKAEKSLQYFHEAASLHVGGKLEQSVRLYTKILEEYPDFREILMFRAYAHEDNGDYGQAVDDYMEAIAVFDYEPFLSTIPVLAMENVRKMKNHDKTIANLVQMIEKQPGRLAYRFLLADIFAHDGDHASAAKVYTEIIGRAPGNINAYIGRASARDKLKAYNDAIADYNYLIEKGLDVYSSRGDVKAALKDFKGAIADYTITMNSLPFPAPQLLFRRGTAYIETGEYAKGIEDLGNASRYPGWSAKAEPWIKRAQEAIADKQQ